MAIYAFSWKIIFDYPAIVFSVLYKNAAKACHWKSNFKIA